MKTIVFKSICLSVILLSAIFTIARDDEKLFLYDLRCCNRQNPEGVESPLLSWKIKSAAEGVSQSGWEVEIASTKELLTSGKADVWKSGHRQSSEQFNILPDIARLVDATGYYWHVRIFDNTGLLSSWSAPAYFSTGLSAESWKAKWITYPNSKEDALPYFRKVYNLDRADAKPQKVMVYLCGLGCSDLYMNGQMVDSTRFLDPAQSDYEQFAFYSSFDVTPLIQKGNNCFGVMLGKGWFTQDAGWQTSGFSYGSPLLRMQIVVHYSDGTRTLLGSDESWNWKEGPVTKSNIYLGESYDARREIYGWCRSETELSGWKNAVQATKNLPARLVSQNIEPIRTKQVLKAVKMWQDSTGNWIFDFGVNTAGIPRLKVQEEAGTHLTIRMAEKINSNGSLDFSTLGWIHHGKIFANEYTCKGTGSEQWAPRFTYHGFRYAELSGMHQTPDLSAVSLVVVHSDLTKTGIFECADPQINRLHDMAMRTVLSNLHGIPTDCPDREKCGWLGDAHAYVKMANLNLQMNNFWLKYLADIRSGASRTEKNTLFHERFNRIFYHTNKPDGLPYMIAPGKRLCGVASPDWGTAMVQLPWWLYVYYGNKTVLSENYEAMKKWTNYVSSLATDTARTNKYNNKTQYIVYQGLGDWCPPGGNGTIDTPIEFTSTAFHYLDVVIMQQVAQLLGKQSDANFYMAQKQLIADEMVANLYDKRARTYGSQTADAMALDFGLVPPGDEKAVSDAIANNMNVEYNGFMHCGIFGIGRIGSMLARYGNSDTAWKMFTKKGENSFEWMWRKAAATTLWEVLPTNTFSQQAGGKGSLNHPMQAGFDVSFYEDIAGIRPDASGYGFKVIRFEPLFTSCLPWAKASIESPYGTVSSDWKNEAGKFTWQIAIPANSTGLVALPKGKKITVNGLPLDRKKYIAVTSNEKNNFYRFPSGNFKILTW